MTMPKFKPVAYQSSRNGFICKENKNPEYNINLHTSDQLIEAHEAGKRDAIPEGWADAYAAFKGAFDTPQMRRLFSDEYAADARKRLREFNEAMLAAAPKGEE